MNRDDLFEIGVDFREGKYPNETWESLNERFGKPFKNGECWRQFVKNRLYKNKKKGERPSLKEVCKKVDAKDNYKETVEIMGDGSYKSDKLLQMSEEQSKDINYLLKAHGFDVKDWELVSARNNIWNVYSKKDGVQQLYASKITVKPRTDSISVEELTEHLKEFAKHYKSPIHKPTNYSKNSKMLEVNIADLHVGKLAWVGETGENYNINIAKERFLYIINDIITRTKHYKFEKILFVWTNDFFHYDTINVTTTAGTRQDSDVRWQKLYTVGIEMLIEGIDLLARHAPVETFYTASNHDKMTSFYAIRELNAWYQKNKYVTVNVDPSARKYVEFGNCLIGFGHGDNEKKRIGGLMPIEAREAWGRTLYHEFHAGHLHSEKAINEQNGIIVRYISSPTSTDAWHYESGYVGAVKKAQSFVWDRKYGLTDILNTVIPIELIENAK